MYENITYELILQRMMDKIPSTFDKREGSIIYNALAPTAAELAQAYIKLDYVNNSMSLDAATSNELTEICYQRGVFRKGATKAIRKGIFNIEVPLNSRFSIDSSTFITLEKITDYEYKLECEQVGVEGNSYVGPIIPIDYIEGLTSAVLTDLIVPAVNEETDEQLRERNRQTIIDPEQDGNVAQYKKWALDYEGIGTAKIFPLWNGGNTVKVAITDRLFRVADSALVNKFQGYLDPGSTGLGNGVAPIGAKVTVTGGVNKEINITGNIVLAEGYTEPKGVAEAISEYFASITYVKNGVSYIRTAGVILDTSSIAELNDFTINGTVKDVVLSNDEIPKLNSINLTVVSG